MHVITAAGSPCGLSSLVEEIQDSTTFKLYHGYRSLFSLNSTVRDQKIWLGFGEEKCVNYKVRGIREEGQRTRTLTLKIL